jgi:hypothetical protein
VPDTSFEDFARSFCGRAGSFPLLCSSLPPVLARSSRRRQNYPLGIYPPSPTLTMASHSSSEEEEPVYPQALASSLAGLPVRVAGASAAGDDKADAAGATNGAGKAQSGQLKDFLDLAVSVLVLDVGKGGTELTGDGDVCAADDEGIRSIRVGYECCE